MSDTEKFDAFLEPLRIALRLENEGKRFFSEAAAKTQSQLVRQTFEFLAAEEDKHIENIERFYKSLELSKGEDVPDIEVSTAEAKLQAFNENLAELKDSVTPSLSDVEAYEVALRFENGAEEFYEQKLLETDDPRIKKFYQWLIDEETMHARLLRSCLLFAKDPTAWFKEHK